MADECGHSVTAWIGSLKSGDAEAARKLWHRYFESLVRVARNRRRGAPHGLADEEDAALSAFDSFVRGAAAGRFQRLGDRNDLWGLLVVITERKVIDHSKRERRLKRGGGKVVGLREIECAEDDPRSMSCVAGAEPTPDFAALAADECSRLLRELRDDSLRTVAVLRMEGHTNEEIARHLNCSLRTVARKIELIRGAWLSEAKAGS